MSLHWQGNRVRVVMFSNTVRHDDWVMMNSGASRWIEEKSNYHCWWMIEPDIVLDWTHAQIGRTGPKGITCRRRINLLVESIPTCHGGIRTSRESINKRDLMPPLYRDRFYWSVPIVTQRLATLVTANHRMPEGSGLKTRFYTCQKVDEKLTSFPEILYRRSYLSRSCLRIRRPWGEEMLSLVLIPKNDCCMAFASFYKWTFNWKRTTILDKLWRAFVILLTR